MKQSASNAPGCDHSAGTSLSKARVALVADLLRSDRKSEQTVRIRVTGESMLPTLWPGDEVEIASCELEDVTPGDIVLAERDGKLSLHRLVRMHEHGFVLCGDSVPKEDPEFGREALLGRLRAVGGIPFSHPVFWNHRLSLGTLVKSLKINYLHVTHLRNNKLEAEQQSSQREIRPKEIAFLWTRAVGILLCYCGPMRSLALRWQALARTQRNFSDSGREPLS